MSDRKPGTVSKFFMQVVWPAFLGAIVAVGVFFSAIDPHELDLVGIHLASSRTGAYTAGFLVFWLLFSVSSGITWWLVRTDRNESGGLQ